MFLLCEKEILKQRLGANGLMIFLTGKGDDAEYLTSTYNFFMLVESLDMNI